MDNSKVSIVVPIYNVQAYLRRCLESLINQTYENIEIVCVDDGSTDNSGSICDEYAKKDSRVRVLHKENGGVSSARNAGLNIAGGGYITFIDSDDYVDLDYIEILSREIEECDAVACCALCRGYENGEIKRPQLAEGKDSIYLNNAEIKEAYERVYRFRRAFYFAVGRLYKANRIEDMQFSEELSKSEDIIFNLQFLQRANKVKIINYAGYVYYDNSESITHRVGTGYSPLLEHGYRREWEMEKVEKLKWGLGEDFIIEEERKQIPTRCWNEIANLFSPGSPYGFREKNRKLKEIITSEEFRKVIGNQRYKELSLGGKLAKICIGLHFPVLVNLFVRLVLLVQKLVINVFGIRKMKVWVGKHKPKT